MIPTKHINSDNLTTDVKIRNVQKILLKHFRILLAFPCQAFTKNQTDLDKTAPFLSFYDLLLTHIMKKLRYLQKQSFVLVFVTIYYIIGLLLLLLSCNYAIFIYKQCNILVNIEVAYLQGNFFLSSLSGYNVQTMKFMETASLTSSSCFNCNQNKRDKL